MISNARIIVIEICCNVELIVEGGASVSASVSPSKSADPADQTASAQDREREPVTEIITFNDRKIFVDILIITFEKITFLVPTKISSSKGS